MNQRPGWVYAVVLVLGIVAGMVLIGTARLVTQEDANHGVHYHANWAVYIDGQRLDLTDDRFMVDVYQCSIDPTRQSAEDRVHMHEGNHDVIHVHAAGVTWGHLLENLGFGYGDDYLYTNTGRYQNTAERTLKLILNGNQIQSIRRQPIRDQDRLLISYGVETAEEVISTQFQQVAADAGEYNHRPDPASCSGQHEETFGDRFRRAFWF
jgi:hypothetical protein